MNLSIDLRRGPGFPYVEARVDATTVCSSTDRLPFRSGASQGVDIRCAQGTSPAVGIALLRESRRIAASDASVRITDADAEIVRWASIAGLDVVADHPGTVLASRPARPETRHGLVSILIPAYRPDFLDEALRSARGQTHTNSEILVGDDCPDDACTAIVERHAAEDLRIRLLRVGPGAGSLVNYLTLFDEAAGEFVKFLNDDDLLERTCVERMVAVLVDHPEVTVVTSHRRRIDAAGDLLLDTLPTLRIAADDCIINGPSAINDVLHRKLNWIGEPTTGLFRRADITDDEPTLFSYMGRRGMANVDVTLWVRLLSRGDLAYLVETQSSFRQHPMQEQLTYEDFQTVAHAAWEQIREDALASGIDWREPGKLATTDMTMRPWWDDRTRTAVIDADEALSAGDLDGAAAAFRAAVEHAPIAVWCAQILHLAGRTAEAVALVESVIREQPTRVPALVSLADLYDASGRPELAARCRETASRLQPFDVELARRAGRAPAVRPAAA